MNEILNTILIFAFMTMFIFTTLYTDHNQQIIIMQNDLIIAQQDETNAYLSTELCYFFNDTDKDFRDCLLDKQD